MKLMSLSLLILLPMTLAAQASPVGSNRRTIKLPPSAYCQKPSLRTPLCDAPFSAGVQVGNTLYTAGIGGEDPQTGKVPPAFEQEAQFALEALQQTLVAAGMTMDDLVSVQVFCTDLSLWDRFNVVYRKYFKKDPPARAFLGVSAIVGGNRLEIMGIAQTQ
jgi:2-iminobutanoate/2-iminopropanoate deaminase